jgi:hypothetical protein
VQKNMRRLRSRYRQDETGPGRRSGKEGALTNQQA